MLGMTITYTRGEDGKVYREKEEFKDEEELAAHRPVVYEKPPDDHVPPAKTQVRDCSLESLTRSQLITLIK